MSELGKFLKAAREERKITLDDLQEITKIQKRYIEAIEAGRYDLLPGPFYTRAFIRNIAENLHLDTERLLAQYENELPSTYREFVEPIPRRRRRRIAGPSLLGQWLTRIILVAFVALIISIVYMFVVKNYPPADQQNVQDKPVDVVDHIPSKQPSKEGNSSSDPPMEEETPPEPPKPTLTHLKTEGKTFYYQIANVKQMDLKMKAERGRCWFQIEKMRNGEVIDSGTLELGDEKSWDLSGLSNVHIRLGATKFMDVWINGELIDTTEMQDSSRIDVTLVPLTE